MKKLYYELLEQSNYPYKKTVNGIEVSSDVFYNKFTEANRYKQEYYTCYFDKDQNFIKKWVMSEEV